MPLEQGHLMENHITQIPHQAGLLMQNSIYGLRMESCFMAALIFFKHRKILICIFHEH